MTDRSDGGRDAALMEQVVRLALESIRDTSGGPFAALIVNGDDVIATGVNAVVPRTDPTAHAEIQAIRAACERLATVDLSGHVLYSSCLPCPMCLAAAHWAGIARVFHALTSADAEIMGFKDAHLYSMFADEDAAVTPQPIRLHLPQADEIVTSWLAKPDRIQY